MIEQLPRPSSISATSIRGVVGVVMVAAAVALTAGCAADISHGASPPPVVTEQSTRKLEWSAP
jgi:hypothetical protein